MCLDVERVNAVFDKFKEALARIQSRRQDEMRSLQDQRKAIEAKMMQIVREEFQEALDWLRKEIA